MSYSAALLQSGSCVSSRVLRASTRSWGAVQSPPSLRLPNPGTIVPQCVPLRMLHSLQNSKEQDGLLLR